MGIITLYECERCGRKWNPQKEAIKPVTVGIYIKYNQIAADFMDYPTASAMWCRDCAVMLGIVEPVISNPIEKEIAPDVPLSFEEKFVSLLAELGVIRE